MAKCSTYLKVDAIQSFVEDPNTECSSSVANFWLGKESGTVVAVEIKDDDLSIADKITSTGSRAYQMLEEGETEGHLECQNVFEDWEENEQEVSFEMKEID